MLIVDHVLRLRRVHVVRVVLLPTATADDAPTAHGTQHAAAASTCPVHEARGGDGGKAVARRDAAAAEGLLPLRLLMNVVRVSARARRRRLGEGNVQRLLH